jgi:hypothetical protein
MHGTGKGVGRKRTGCRQNGYTKGGRMSARWRKMDNVRMSAIHKESVDKRAHTKGHIKNITRQSSIELKGSLTFNSTPADPFWR